MPEKSEVLKKNIWRENPDRHIAVLLSLLVFVLFFFSLDNNCLWGDDFAAYLSEGIAIAEGRLDEQAELNTMMHLTELPEKSQGKPIVYAWGYPLVHSLVYRLAGFDRVEYNDLVYYKLVTVFAFAAAAGLFIFFAEKALAGSALCFCTGFFVLIPSL